MANINKLVQNIQTPIIEQLSKTIDKIAVNVEQETQLVENLATPSVRNLQVAFGNISFAKNPTKYISKNDFTKYLSGLKGLNSTKFDKIYSSICDKGGEVTQEGFDLLLSFQKKKNIIEDTVKLFEAAKQDDKINYKALHFIDSIMPEKTSPLYYQGDDHWTLILKSLKEPSGEFNKTAMQVVEKDIPSFQKYFEIDENILNGFKNDDKTFSNEALQYFIKNLDEKVPIKDLFADLALAKEKGHFDFDRIPIFKDIEQNFIYNDFYKVKNLIEQTPKENRSKILEILKSINDDGNFEMIMNYQSILGNTITPENLAFAKKIGILTKNNTENFQIFNEKLQITPEKLDERIEKLLERVTVGMTKEELSPLLEAATIKNGENIGQLNINKLEKYLDIHNARKFTLGNNFVKKIASCLSLEEDDRALNIFRELYTMELPAGIKLTEKQQLSPQNINCILKLMTLSANDIPKRKIPTNILEKFEQLLDNKFAKKSIDIFENFIITPDLKAMEKLEHVNFMEIGMKPKQASSEFFQNTDEKELMKFKEFLKKYLSENNIKDFDISSNSNIAEKLNITSGDEWQKHTLLYDFKNQKPTTDMNIYEHNDRIQTFQRDFTNNTETTINNTIINDSLFSHHLTLCSQTVKHYDDNGKIIYTEVFEKSPIKNVFNIKKVYPDKMDANLDGHIEKVMDAYIDSKTGNEIIEKNMKSFDGSISTYRNEIDKEGNQITDYIIKDKDGNIALKQSFRFEKIDDFNFRTSKNNIEYNTKVVDRKLVVTNENTNEVITIDVDKLTEGTENDLLPLLKLIPADELFRIKQLDLKNIKFKTTNQGACYLVNKNSIIISSDNDDLATLLHELGHYKDYVTGSKTGTSLSCDETLNKIYNAEIQAYRKNMSEPQLDLIGYFIADKHYLGMGNAIKEGLAETNTLLNSYPKNDVQNIRTHYWQQYFPNTISYLSKLLDT